MEIIIYVIGLLVILGLIVLALAYIGLKVKKKEQQDMADNVKAIERFVEINKNKKYSRKSTRPMTYIRTNTTL